MRPDGHREVDIWFLHLDSIVQSELTQMLSILDAKERLKAKGLSRESQFREYVATRAMVRVVLSMYEAVSPEYFEFALNPYGKPYVVEPQRGRFLRFSVSHTHGLIAVAVSSEIALGIDVEKKRREPKGGWKTGGLFSSKEKDRIMSMPDSVRSECYLKYWTLKEAYSKAYGVGVSMPFNSIIVSGSDMVDGGIVIQHDNRRRVDGVVTVLLDYIDEYYVSVVTSPFSDVAPSIISCRKFIALLEAKFSSIDCKEIHL